MTNEEYLRTAPTDELARYITSCGYCAYLTDGCQRGQGCVEGHKLWLERAREGKPTNRDELLARLLRYDTAQLADALYGMIKGHEYVCDICLAENYCRSVWGETKQLRVCYETIAAWLEAEAE